MSSSIAVTTLSSSLGFAAVRDAVTKAVTAAVSASASATTTSFASSPPIVFNLEVADGCRDTMLRYAKEVFDASAAASMGSRVDVVPFFPSAAAASSSSSFAPFSKEVMIPEKGFSPQFSYVAMGGTFDHLHAGHKLLLLTSASFATRRLRIGVTSAALLGGKKFATELQPFEARRDEVVRYVSSVRPDLELDVAEISDMAGGTDVIESVEALVVSPETLPALEKVNAMRHERGYAPMALVQIPYIGGDDDASRVSSTKIRQMRLQQQQGQQQQEQ